MSFKQLIFNGQYIDGAIGKSHNTKYEFYGDFKLSVNCPPDEIDGIPCSSGLGLNSTILGIGGYVQKGATFTYSKGQGRGQKGAPDPFCIHKTCMFINMFKKHVFTKHVFTIHIFLLFAFLSIFCQKFLKHHRLWSIVIHIIWIVSI